jgi:PPM family protein phosphatase
VRVEIGAKSDVGRVREANEDSYLIDDPLFVVADGMGGHIAGDVASSTAVKVISDESYEASQDNPSTLQRIVADANAAIWQRAQSDPSLRGMGTTCTLVLVDEDRVHIAHVGDSRAYRFRDGHLEQLTQDHTLVGRMVAEGRLQPEEAQTHPQRSIITRALGVDESVQVDLETVDVVKGDRILMCSDGLPSMVDDGGIEDILRGETDPQRAAERLIERANDAGGEDNITVVVIDFTDQARPRAMVTGDGRGRTQAPPREDTEPDRREAPPAPAPKAEAEPPARRTWVRKLIVGLVIAAILVAGAVFAANYVLDNSWYVGANNSGEITIYRGIPDEIGTLTLREPEQTATITLEDLPPFKRDDVRRGIRADNQGDAQATLDNLKDLARDFREQNRQGKNSNNK